MKTNDIPPYVSHGLGAVKSYAAHAKQRTNLALGGLAAVVIAASSGCGYVSDLDRNIPQPSRHYIFNVVTDRENPSNHPLRAGVVAGEARSAYFLGREADGVPNPSAGFRSTYVFVDSNTNCPLRFLAQMVDEAAKTGARLGVSGRMYKGVVEINECPGLYTK